MKTRCTLPIFIALALGGCTSWPQDGRGGFAERRAVEEPRLEMLTRRFEDQRVRGGDVHAAGLSHEVRTLLVRAQRNHAADIHDDLEIDLSHIARSLDAIDRSLPRKP